MFDEPAPEAAPPPPAAPAPRMNEFGLMAPSERPTGVMDVGPGESGTPVVRGDPTVVGAGKAKPLAFGAPAAAAGPVDWSSVGRNDPCPCGSGKKFKKCHGVGA
jgi:hypothetical protein